MTTVLELAGQDQSGLLADVTHLLTTNGCDVRSAAVRISVAPHAHVPDQTYLRSLHGWDIHVPPVIFVVGVDVQSVMTSLLLIPVLVLHLIAHSSSS